MNLARSSPLSVLSAIVFQSPSASFSRLDRLVKLYLDARHARETSHSDRQKAALLAAAAARLANVATIFLRPASLIMAIALLGSTHCVVR